MATGVIFYPRSVGTAHHAYHRDNLPGGEEFEAKAANSFTLTDKPGRSNPVSIKATPYGISARRVANVVEFEERQLAPKLEPATAEPRVSIFVSIIYPVSAGRQITRCQMPVQVPRMFYVETSEFGRPIDASHHTSNNQLSR